MMVRKPTGSSVTSVLIHLHPWLGYFVTVVFVLAIVLAFGKARDAREFTVRPFAIAMILLDVHVLLGIVLYGMGSYWDASSAVIAYVHPALALLALVIGHVTLRKARDEPMAVASHRKVARGFIITLLLIVAAIGVASAPIG